MLGLFKRFDPSAEQLQDVRYPLNLESLRRGRGEMEELQMGGTWDEQVPKRSM